LPWCERKCPYCDFNSFEARGDLREREYVDALLRDLTFELENRASLRNRQIDSIYIGGGTPSLFSGAAIDRLLRGIHERVTVAGQCEITLEANPGSAESGRFDGYRSAGVNRLSIGVQSFRDELLARLGRVHDGSDARAAVGKALAAGFDSVNIDLMYGLPGDSAHGALEDLDCALSLQPTHISWYQLALEPGTAFFRKPPALPAEDDIAAVEESGRDRLQGAGYERYEISGYAREGFRCRHNLNYWRFGDYIGVGAGAHGKLSMAATGAIERTSRLRNPGGWMAAAGTAAAVTTASLDDPEDLILEFMMNALRLVDGVPAGLFSARTGLPPEAIAAARAQATDKGWFTHDARLIGATPPGLELLNRVLALF